MASARKKKKDKARARLRRLDEYRWEIPRTGGMRVPGLVFASEVLAEGVREDPALDQVANVAHLPGIVVASMAMPDIHWGYGFPIGGVAAFDVDAGGVVSPGGVGFDINCGVRLLRSDLSITDLRPRLESLVDTLFLRVPSGLGSSRSDLCLSKKDLRQVMLRGAGWAVRNGYGDPDDLRRTEAHGALEGADPSRASERALARGARQLGTLGSGNHFCEVGYVDEVHDEAAAEALGLEAGQVTVSIHTGSRGFGYQICDENLKGMVKAAAKHGISLPDRQLCCAPVESPEGQRYLSAMAAAANFAFANRQVIQHSVLETFERVLSMGPKDHGLRLVYDVAHNIARLEEHEVDGELRRLCVHRKGATRAFPPGHPEVPDDFRQVGQPVLIPGDMGRYSFVLVGTEGGYSATFGSTCHGAGRVLSRGKAKKAGRGRSISAELAAQGILVRAVGRATLVEEMPEAYKDVADVVETVEGAGIGRKVARLRPVAVVKG